MTTCLEDGPRNAVLYLWMQVWKLSRCIRRRKVRQCGKRKLNEIVKIKKKTRMKRNREEKVGKKRSWTKWSKLCLLLLSQKPDPPFPINLAPFLVFFLLLFWRKATVCTATLVPIYQTTRCWFPEDRKLGTRFCQKLNFFYLSLISSYFPCCSFHLMYSPFIYFTSFELLLYFLPHKV